MKVEFEWFDPRILTGMKEVQIRLNEYGNQDHARWTFRKRTWRGSLYYKVWRPSYIRKDRVLLGLATGFYSQETVPALKSLLIDETGCRGYVMRAAKPSTPEFDPEFLETIHALTSSCGVYYYDLRPHHVMSYQGMPCLIDLEGIYRLTERERMKHENAFFGSERYREFVESLL